MTNLYLLKYNNYTDRIIKRESWTMNQIRSYLVDNGEPDENGNLPIVEDTNFIMNDALTTEVVVNWVGEKPNYVARVINPDNKPTADYWFVMGYKYNDFGQMTLYLKRDLLRTYWDDVVGSNAFIERGTPISKDDSAIYNREDCTFNQVKTGEYPIKDEFGIPWVVGYIPINTPQTDLTPTFKNYSLKTIEGNFSDDPIRSYSSVGGVAPEQKIKLDPFQITYHITILTQFEGNYYKVTLDVDADGNYIGHTAIQTTNTTTGIIFELPTLIQSAITIDKKVQYILYAEVVDSFLSKIEFDYKNPYNKVQEQSQNPTRIVNKNVFERYNEYNKNLITYDEPDVTTDVYYESAISAIEYYDVYESLVQLNSTNSSFGLSTREDIYSPTTANHFQTLTVTKRLGSTVTYKGRYDYMIASQGSPDATHHLLIPGPEVRQPCLQQPYHMFAIPLTDDPKIIGTQLEQEIVLSRYGQLQFVTLLTEKLGTDNIYDLQILPYCPCRQYFDFSGSYPKLSNIAFNNKSVCNPMYFKDNAEKEYMIGIVLWCSSASTSFEVMSPYQQGGWPSIQSKKVTSETEMMRICSPGYSAVMEFNPAHNDGITAFNVDMLATPYTPYIQVAPNFGGLYGRDFNDQRGMKSGDDISLPQISNAWTNYKVQNKNWLNQFNRQIENQMYHDDMAFGKDVVSIFTGGAQGAAAGGFLGKLGGGLIGAGVSMLGGIADAWMNQAERFEDQQYNIDMFKMNMQNIIALPNTINKGSILSPTFKYFPFLETYSCTDSEKLALNMLIKFQGMKINRFGTIAQYLNPDNPYIRGFIVRYKGNLPAHIIDEINRELKMGVYLYGANPVRD